LKLGLLLLIVLSPVFSNPKVLNLFNPLIPPCEIAPQVDNLSPSGTNKAAA
jgi:hypothetical protein